MASMSSTGQGDPTVDPSEGTAVDAGGQARLEAPSVDECLALLRRHVPKIGRVAFVENGEPVVLPVNYAYDRGTILIRTDHGASSPPRSPTNRWPSRSTRWTCAGGRVGACWSRVGSRRSPTPTSWRS